MREKYRRLLSLLLSVIMVLSMLPAAAAAPQVEEASDEALWEQFWDQYWAEHPDEWAALEESQPAKRDVSTTLAAMRARAEALVNYTWTPTSNISTWNGSSYRGMSYFPAGQPVTGVPYTLFTSEIVYWGLCSLEQYKEVASKNYSVTAYCTSVGSTRTGPVYGSCCADLVSEVLGGSFLNGRSPRYHNVGSVKRSPYGNTYTDQKMAAIRAGDALSDVGENHIIWIGDVTNSTITVYEQTPPVARKRVLDKAEYTNGSGYFVYGGKIYSTITRSKELIAGPPTNAAVTTDHKSYEVDGLVTFTVKSDGTSNNLWIYRPNGSSLIYQNIGSIYQLRFGKTGHYQALVETWNSMGSMKSELIDFVVGPPTYAKLSTEKAAYGLGETVAFEMDSDGDTNDLWVYCPDGTNYYCQDLGSTYETSFDQAGHYQAFIETWNEVGVLCSKRIDFEVGTPAFVSVTTNKTSYKAGENVTFTCISDGNTNTLWIYCPDGTHQYYQDVGKTRQLNFTAYGEYRALVQTWNAAGVITSGEIFFSVECEHSYSAQTVVPTCGQEGYTVYTCAICGDSYTDRYLDPLGHDFRFSVTASPAPDTPGVLTGTCARCGGVRSLSLPALNAQDYLCTVTKEASCTEPGSADYVWKNETYGEFRFSAELPRTAHRYEAAVTEPKCTEKGFTTHTCSVCGAAYSDEETPALDHAWDEGVEIKQPTETEPGETVLTCTRCGEVRTAQIPVIGHVHEYTEQVIGSTCTEPGATVHTCAICGDVFRDGETSALGHSFGEWTEVQAASCARSGAQIRTCIRCGEQEYQQIPALGHIYEASVTAPTCLSQGYTVQTCSRCGGSYVDSYTDALSHTYSYALTLAPTARRPGVLTGTCTACGSKTAVPLPKLNSRDYTYQVTKEASCAAYGAGKYTWNTTEFGNYSFEVRIAKPAHRFKDAVTAPSCAGYGFTSHTCTVCGVSYRDKYTSVRNHEWNEGSVVRKPTATESGIKAYLCDMCGAMMTKTIPSMPHIHSYTKTVVKPTCTKAGYTHYECSCGAAHNEDKKPALGHNWNKGAVTVKPTYLAKGEKTFTCTRCGEKKTEAIPKLSVSNLPCDGGASCPGRQFADMPAKRNWAHNAIDWAIVCKITSGTTKTSFSPDDGCTRGQVVTFLWRAAGKPDPKSGNNPFRDVKSGAFYEKAVLWAVEKGITKGTSASTFSPDATCTRGQIVAFLWRFDGAPKPAAKSSPFNDVKAGAYYEKAVAWAVSKGITRGTSASAFSPDATCTRAQVVTFLYREVKK